MHEPASTHECGQDSHSYLALAGDLFSRADEIAKKLEAQGETVNVIRAVERVALNMNADREELIGLWATLECATLAVRRIASSIPTT